MPNDNKGANGLIDGFFLKYIHLLIGFAVLKNRYNEKRKDSFYIKNYKSKSKKIIGKRLKNGLIAPLILKNYRKPKN